MEPFGTVGRKPEHRFQPPFDDRLESQGFRSPYRSYVLRAENEINSLSKERQRDRLEVRGPISEEIVSEVIEERVRGCLCSIDH